MLCLLQVHDWGRGLVYAVRELLAEYAGVAFERIYNTVGDLAIYFSQGNFFMYNAKTLCIIQGFF